MQLALRQICWPLSHQLSEALGTRGTLDSLELLTDRFSFAHENSYPPQVLTVCLLRIVQVHRLQSNQPSLKVTFTKSVFIWRTLPFLTGIQRFTHVKLLSSSSEEARITDEDRSSEFTYRGCQLECVSKVMTDCALWQSEGGNDWDNPS